MTPEQKAEMLRRRARARALRELNALRRGKK
jgi:hypothetical protein